MGAEVAGTVPRGMRTPKGKREPSRGETGTDMKPRVKDDGGWKGREEYIREGLRQRRKGKARKGTRREGEKGKGRMVSAERA